ncbi:ABC transporter permease [Micromonospora robiginosa]|uniref:Autoinducer 2 import system permease protein LsrD n=1 Tax=Micromonospora robiginosa TaxID=2749844 RepID=A0A7L6B4R5_9ACTN|nr:ABC transporter permease [Micromonospora ferruginea]QLQ36580.1 ABC transporter permease [Micromonospora ferruginea]
MPDTLTTPPVLVRQNADRSRPSTAEWLVGATGRFGLVGLLVLVIATFSALSPSTYFTVTNFRLILVNQTVTVIVALAATLPLLAHYLDASVGPMLGLAQGLAVWLIAVRDVPVWLAVVAVLAAAVAVGVLNTLLVLRFGMSSIIATLATGSVLMGLLYLITGGRVIFQNVPESFTGIARGDLAGIPLPLLYLLAIVIVLEVVVVWTPFGQRMYSMDGNLRGAARAGIDVNSYTLRAFVGAAVLAALAGLLLASRIGSGQPAVGQQFLLPAFAAAFLGAAVLRPGRVNMLGTLIAAYFVSFTIAGLQHLGAATWIESVFNGVAVIGGVSVAGLAVRRRRRLAVRHVERLEAEHPEPPHPASERDRP